MEFFKIHRDIPFMRHALVFNLISFVTFLAAVFFLFSRGLHLSVEFTGGTLMEVSYAQPADLAAGAQPPLPSWASVMYRCKTSAPCARCADPAASAKGSQLGKQSDQVMAALKAADPSVHLRRRICGPTGGR
jgi:preprotein translocase subunit SecF